jgi:hypothetical protein
VGQFQELMLGLAMQYSPDKEEIIFFIVAILITLPMAVLFRKLKRQLKEENSDKN